MKQIILIFFGSAMLLSQCVNDGKSRSFSIYNNYGKPICYHLGEPLYPDTLLPVKKSQNFFPIIKEAHWKFCEIGCNEDDLFALFPADTLSVFLFDYDMIERYDWQIIREDYMILVRYDFSQDDLNRLNWKIYYPPTEEMKDMKMYPPYGVNE